MLPESVSHLYRYAINLARMGWLRAPDGRDIAIGDALAPFRQWLREQLLSRIPRHFTPDAAGLIDLAPLVAIRVEAIRQALTIYHANDFSAETLDLELRHKRLALVLGGGGGCGLAHLGLFGLLHEMEIEPSYIIGSSMGALVGLIRAVQRRYDPVMAMLALPKRADLKQIFRPFSGFSRYGFPGAVDLHLSGLTKSIFRETLGIDVPRFDELPIHLEVVVTGIRAGLELGPDLESAYSKASKGGWTPFGMRQKLRLFFDTAKKLASNPRLLTQLVFNDEPGTHNMSVLDAIGFSCSVPGLLHFDLFKPDPHLAHLLESIFDRHQLFRFTDGGVVNNVPSRVAWTSIQKGKIGHRNAFIYGVDPFAPIPNHNALFIPMQRVVRPSVLANRPYSDFTRTVHSSPSPINLAPSYGQLKRIVQRSRKEFIEDAPFIRRMMTPLPPYQQWSQRLGLGRSQSRHAIQVG